jgi:VanZ family protein
MPSSSAASRAAVRGAALLVGLALLIVYGSLYPFNFSTPEPGSLQRLFSDWTLTSTRGDMLGNVALFVPWGLAGVLVSAPRTGARRAVWITAVAGFVLALGCQIAQLWTPSRNAALADVFWNMLGVAAGLVLGRRAQKRLTGSAAGSAVSVVAACLLVAWLLAFWLPLVPSLDLQLVKDNLKSLLDTRTFSFAGFMPGLAMALLSGYLLSQLVGIRASLVCLPAWLALAVLGKLFVYAARSDVSAPLGFVVGTVLWWASPWIGAERRRTLVAMLLIAAYTLQSLSPFEFRDTPGAFGWSPLAAMLEGSMLSNAQALLDSALSFLSFLYLVRVGGGRPAVASLGLAVWVLGIEIAQTFIVTRTADITLPLLVVLLGQAWRMPWPPPREVEPQVNATPPAHAVVAQSAHSRLRPLLAAAGVVALTTFGLSAMLRLPALPYNVRELFLGGGHPLALAVFALALLWVGASAAWIGHVVANARRPAWLLPPLALVVSLISLLLLWLSVTTESIGDVAGSTNLYWFVTNRDTWGAAWRVVFLSIDAPELISFLERCVRYAALYAPLPIFLGLMVAVRLWPWRHSTRPGQVLGVVASALLTLWLCKAIAFDWSSTDNLNELIARDGAWGWGGGGYLYLLLALVCLNSLMLAEGAGHALALLGGALLTVLTVPLGWWLLNQGLEAAVEKYGSVFSGAQFFLGPDRRHALPAQVLFARWAAVQLSVTLVIATGTWLGLAICALACSGGPSSATQSGRTTRHPGHQPSDVNHRAT